jgi:hypothetical protein
MEGGRCSIDVVVGFGDKFSSYFFWSFFQEIDEREMPFEILAVCGERILHLVVI